MDNQISESITPKGKTAMRRKLLVFSAIVLSMANSTAFAGSVAGTGGSTEVTQLLNNAESAMQTAQQVSMVQNQLASLVNQAKNLTTAPAQVWGQAQSELEQLASLIAKGQSLSYSAQNIDQVFREKFPGYSSPGSDYKAWGRTALDGVSAALQSAGLQANQFASERAAIQSIQNISAGSPGALQAIQAGNMIASQQFDQLQKLRDLMVKQQLAQSSFMANELQGQADKNQAVEAWMRQGNGKVRKAGTRGMATY